MAMLNSSLKLYKSSTFMKHMGTGTLTWIYSLKIGDVEIVSGLVAFKYSFRKITTLVTFGSLK